VDLKVEIQAEGQGFWAHVLDLPGCFASGGTLDELHEALGEAVGLYLWDRPASIGAQELRVGAVQVNVEGPQET
jgi:predicted RNase H-like HicB family nuclease